MPEPTPKPIRWVGSSRKDLRAFPSGVRHVMGTGLYLAQCGLRHPAAKAWKGVAPGAGILEIAEEFESNAYRVVYSIAFPGAVYVLHAFKKKSTSGIGTPRHHVELVRARFQWAREDYESEFGGES